jgi:hypothetical protein
VRPDPEFVFHFLYPVFGKADSAAKYQGYTDFIPMHADDYRLIEPSWLQARSLARTSQQSIQDLLIAALQKPSICATLVRASCRKMLVSGSKTHFRDPI